MKKVVLVEDSKVLAGALQGALELENITVVWKGWPPRAEKNRIWFCWI